jgi:hypothetical protein
LSVESVVDAVSRQPSTPSLTGTGRDLAVEIADSYVEADIERRFSSKEECREFAATHGFELLATGLGRDIYRVPVDLLTADRDCVLKIPSRLIGSYENRREALYWRELPAAVRRQLAPVYDDGVEWILMPEADQDLTSGEILELWSSLREAGWACEDANWQHNLGRVDGRPVILDYGAGCHEI